MKNIMSLEIGDLAMDLITKNLEFVPEILDSEKIVRALGETIYLSAERLFESLGFKDDFCHQAGLVFGGSNRVKWTQRGWEIDPPYCSPNFREAWAKKVFSFDGVHRCVYPGVS